MAAKINSTNIFYGVINDEYQAYQHLKSVKLVPKVYGLHHNVFKGLMNNDIVFGDYPQVAIIMDLLGPSLKDVFKQIIMDTDSN